MIRRPRRARLVAPTLAATILVALLGAGYASVNKKNNHITTGSSRSLALVGINDDLAEAEKICEQALTNIKGDHLFIRHDIGTKKLLEKRIHHMQSIRGKI